MSDYTISRAPRFRDEFQLSFAPEHEARGSQLAIALKMRHARQPFNTTPGKLRMFEMLWRHGFTAERIGGEWWFSAAGKRMRKEEAMKECHILERHRNYRLTGKV